MEEDKVKKYNLLLDKLIDISKVSYEQENDRNKQLLNKSDLVIRYVSTIIIFVNIFIPFAFTNKFIDIKISIIMYFISSIPLLISLFYSVRAQILKPIKAFPTGRKVIDTIKLNRSEFDSDYKVKNKVIMYYSSSTDEMQKANDTRAGLVTRAYGYFMASYTILIIIILTVLILIA